MEALKALKGVQGVVTSNGQFQVVIGTDVPAVYDEIVKLGSFGSTTGSAPSDEKVGPVAKVLGAITAIFQPILPAICGAGMIRAVLALLVFLNAIDSSSQTYVMLNMFADAAFYFLPVVLGFSAANYFKCNAFIAAILCAMLLHPTFTGLVGAGEAVSLFGLPVRLASYGNAVVSRTMGPCLSASGGREQPGDLPAQRGDHPGVRPAGSLAGPRPPTHQLLPHCLYL